MKGRISNEKIQLHPYSPHPETPTHEHINTHQCGFSIQTNGRRVGQSCAVTTTDLCNDMKINTCGETVPDNAGQALMRAILKTATQCFPFESSFFFLPFLFMSGVREDGRRMAGVKGGKEVSRKHISLTANTAHPYCLLKVTVGLNVYLPTPFPCVGAAALFRAMLR